MADSIGRNSNMAIQNKSTANKLKKTSHAPQHVHVPLTCQSGLHVINHLTSQQNEENFQSPQEHYERGMLVCPVMIRTKTWASCGLMLTF